MTKENLEYIRDVIVECRPMVKGRLSEDPTHGDIEVLWRIATALEMLKEELTQ